MSRTRLEAKGLLLVLLLVSMLTACGAPTLSGGGGGEPAGSTSGETKAEKKETASGEKTTVTWLQWWKGEQGEKGAELFAKIEKGFEEQHPDIDLVIEDMPFGEAKTKIVTTHAGGIPPDVITLSSPWVAEFAAAGIVTPLDDYFQAMPEEFQKANVGPYWVPWKGKHYSMGFITGNQALFYNKRLLAEANVKVPTTWDEYLQACLALADPSANKYCFTGNIAAEPPATINTEVWPFMLQAGATLIKDGRAAFNTPEGVQAWEFYKSLIKEHKVATPGELSATEQDKRANFSAENTAFMFDGPWGIGIQQSANPNLDFGVAPLPIGKQAGTVAGGGALAIPSASKNKDAAWKFIAYMMDPNLQIEWAKVTSNFPHNKKALEHEFIQGNPMMKVFADQNNALNPINPDLQMPESSNMRKIMIEEMQNYLTDKKTAQQALDDAAARWNEIYAKYE